MQTVSTEDGAGGAPHDDGPWWSGAVGYEVYLRSFADGDGDGVGDLPGLIDKLPYLAWLGVDVVWVTPFYPSPMADHGYDVSDYLGVDPRYGSLADVDRLIGEVHRLGMRLVIDLVPNHTSSEHPWFVEARADPLGSKRDHYIWRDPAPDGGPPNNWISHFGGPAWTLDEASGRYWLHLFLPEQPDLNWRSPEVAREFDEILRFWLERGVDGFRVDVAHGLVKDAAFRDNPIRAGRARTADPRSDFAAFHHVHDLDRPETLDVHRRWKTIARGYDAVLLGEVYLDDPERIGAYVGGGGLDLGFTFGLLWTHWEPGDLRDALRAAVDHSGPGACWLLSSHDDPRAVTRFGGGGRGRRRALALATLLAGLPGALFLYQGDELGLEDGLLGRDGPTDPIVTRNPGAEAGRDGSRTPMPWRPGPGRGFTAPGVAPWLPEGGRADADTVETQRDDPLSPLSRHRRLLAVRRDLDLAHDSPVSWLGPVGGDGPVVAYRREDVVVAANVGEKPAALPPLPGEWAVVFGSEARSETNEGGAPVELAADEAVILRRR